MSIQSTPFHMAFGLETVMPIEFQVPSMAQLEQRQRQRKAFVDRHRKGLEKELPIDKLVLLFQTQLGSMPGKLRFRWTVPFWIIDEFNDTFQLDTLVGDIVKSWANGF